MKTVPVVLTIRLMYSTRRRELEQGCQVPFGKITLWKDLQTLLRYDLALLRSYCGKKSISWYMYYVILRNTWIDERWNKKTRPPAASVKWLAISGVLCFHSDKSARGEIMKRTAIKESKLRKVRSLLLCITTSSTVLACVYVCVCVCVCVCARV